MRVIYSLKLERETMKKIDFKQETFGYPEKGEPGFKGGGVYGKPFKDMHHQTAFLKMCFDYEIWDSDHKRVPLSFGKNSKNVLVQLWKKAEDLKEFKELIKCDPKARLLQFTGVLLGEDTDFLHSFVSAENYETLSDVGGLKVGNSSFNIVIPNGYGDGRTLVSLNGKGTFNTEAFNFWGTLKGDNIGIYSYDCGDEVIKTISGNFGVFYKNGLIILEEWI